MRIFQRLPNEAYGISWRTLDEEPSDRGKYKESSYDDSSVEKELLGASALVEGGREIVAAEGSSEGRAAVLQHDPDDEEGGEDYLYIGQCRNEGLHLCPEGYHIRDVGATSACLVAGTTLRYAPASVA